MKVAIINNAWRGTGVGRYMYKLFMSFKKMRKDVEMIYLEVRKPFGLNDKKIKVLRTPLKFPFFRAVLNNYFYFPSILPNGYDIYHVSNQTIAKCCSKVKPNILSVADIFALTARESYDPFTNFFLKKHLNFLNSSDKIITISEYTKKDLINVLKLPEDKIEVIHLGVDHTRFRKRSKNTIRKKFGLPQNKKIILHIGKDEPRKNIYTLIKSFYKLRKRISNILLVREGTQTKETSRLIKDLKLENDIIQLNLDTRVIHLLYNVTDVFIFPSYYEGFGLPVIEAMASGIPVITSNATSIPEIVGNAGIMVDPFDVNGLANAMYDILTSEDIQEDMSKKGLRRSKLFSWEKTARKTWKVYENI